MCGIIISTLDIPTNAYNLINNRGPDYTNVINLNGINFVHFLLNLTGELTHQPIIDNNIICIFNGEIYNYKEILPDALSDSYSIVETYKKYGKDFISYLDGEFTIILFDFNKNLLFIASDIFKTKPLFYSIDEDIVISSYESVCKKIKNQNYNKINPNEVLVFDLLSKKLIEKKSVYTFDLNQFKNSYDDFHIALENAILKRYPEKNIPLISLSSGTDSGVIACCLNKYKKTSLFVSFSKNEDSNIILKRKEILGDSHILLHLNDDEKSYWKQYLYENCERFNWDWSYHPNMCGYIVNGFDMGSMLGKCKIINTSMQINNDIRVLYSGIGADEVMANNSFYSQGWGNVDYFPDDLSKIFPWANFYNGSMENYLKGDEYVGGSFGYETRYPFCDKNLVQEFLWLIPQLKNEYKGSNYKPALTSYLDKEKFPLIINKYGFNV
uniref:Glutamine amidotransferase type-2 domain-containing protein n=1 Tax=viral metagenome TaxID=1070528 RepID=A0A6C0JRM9_9ZZZZ